MKKIVFLIFLFTVSLFTQWNPQNLTSGNFGNRVHMVNSSRGYLLLTIANQNKIVHRTENGGSNWTATSYIQPSSYQDIFFTSENTGYIAGPLGSIMKTVDGGNTFAPLVTGITENLSRISFLNEYTGYSSGANGTVIRTTNAGVSWTAANIPGAGIVRFDLIDANSVIAASGLNAYRTTNSGANWQISPLTGENSTGVDMVNSLTGYISGSNSSNYGSINKTTDGGLTWQPLISNFQSPISGICFISENTGYIYGGIGSSIPSLATSMIGKTTNGGSNWYFQVSGSNWPVTDMSFSGTEAGLVAAFSVVAYTSNGGGAIGIQQVSSNLPEEFSISQNYPNPFNPVTNIEFAIPKSSFVKLAVFDITGRELETLVSQNMKPGTYKADWDASKYSSGIYFYTITTGGFTQTKKMILTK